MASIIFCDHVRHIVEESRSEVERRLHEGRYEHVVLADDGSVERSTSCAARFVYFTPLGGDTQRALNVSMVSSFEAMPGDPI